MRKRVLCLLLCAVAAASLGAPCFANAPPIEGTLGDFTYALMTSTASITGYSGEGDTIEIPAEIEGRVVTYVSKDAFGERPEVTKLIIPTSIEGVAGSFSGLTNVQTVELVGASAPMTGSPLAIEDGVLTVTNYKGGKEILLYPSSKTDELYEVPEHTYEVRGAFPYNMYLRAIILPAELWRIEPGDLDGLVNLKKVQLRSVSDPGVAVRLYVDENGALWKKSSDPEIADVKIWEPKNAGTVAGDVTADGKLNAKDVTALMRYLVGKSVTIDAGAADFNSDGKVNAKDVTAIMKAIVSAGA